MAGAGYKLYLTGDVLSAADVNNYIQEQTVMRFASSAARTSALSLVLAEGMMSYLQDTDSVEVYNGSAWVGVANSGDITGVTAGTGISGGGTSGTVTITNSMATAITTAGDLIKGTGSGTFDRLGIGSTSQVLTVVAGAPAWASPAGAANANYTLLNSGGTALTGNTTITVSSLSGNQKFLIYIDAASAGASSEYTMRFNTDSTTKYDQIGRVFTSTSANAGVWTAAAPSATSFKVGQQGTSAGNEISAYIAVDGANATGLKTILVTGFNDSAAGSSYITQGSYTGTSVISSISIISSVSNFDVGRIYVYGSGA